MKSGGVKLVLWAQTGPFSEMTRPRLSVFPHVSYMLTLSYSTMNGKIK